MKEYLLREFLACAKPFLENESLEQFQQRLELVEDPQKQFLAELKTNPMWFGLAMRSLDEEGNFHVYYHYEKLPLKPWEAEKSAQIALRMMDYGSKPVIQVTSYHRINAF